LNLKKNFLMNLSKRIGALLDYGLTPDFVMSLNESTISALYERVSKKETKEQTTQPVNATKTTKTTDVYKLNPDASMEVKGNAVVSNKGGQTTVEMMEDELEEKFESKAQQGLFWARCNKCKSENCKWCKMAKEFSKSTSKKQYKNMPEKKHPEKTVKYKKKKETKEEFTFKDYGKKIGSIVSGKLGNESLKSLRPTFESINEKELDKLVKESLMPSLTKKQLIALIENEVTKRKTLNEDFYAGEMDEKFDFDFMSDVETAPIVKPPKIKPKRETEPEWEPDEDEPVIPNPDVKPEPQAKEDDFSEYKDDFDFLMKRMNESIYKPVKYKKF